MVATAVVVVVELVAVPAVVRLAIDEVVLVLIVTFHRLAGTCARTCT